MSLREAQSQQLFRVRAVLEMRATTHLHPFHGPTINALLRNALRAGGGEFAVNQFLIDVPEQCRTELHAGEQYAFGMTLVAANQEAAASQLANLAVGLRDWGTNPAPPKTVLGGNFSLVELYDLVGRCPIGGESSLQPISHVHVMAEIERLRGAAEVTLRFSSPLRAQLPVTLKDEDRGHTYFDRRAFPVGVLLSRLAGRVRGLHVAFNDPEGYLPGAVSDLEKSGSESRAQIAPFEGTVKDNRLVWLDVSYGPRGMRKSLGGVVGRVRITLNTPAALPWLVWGQYVRVGESTGFGLGEYRIEELGPNPFACQREFGLLELACRPPHNSRAFPNVTSPPLAPVTVGRVQLEIPAILDGSHLPEPLSHISIPRPSRGVLRMAVPSARDLELQRRVTAILAPAMERFFQSSSIANRPDLGPSRAARIVEEALWGGARFFDQVLHTELDARIRAYLADDRAADLLMTWVRAAAPHADRGIALGGAITPMLASLFLDQLIGSENPH